VIGVNLSAIDAVGGTNVIDVAALALVAYDADVGTNVIDVAALELTAYEEDTGTNVNDVAALELVNSATKKAEEVIVKNRKQLDVIANALIEKETIEGPDFEKLFAPIDKQAAAKPKKK
jgi:ATP-dependent Zn protease